MLVAVAGFVVIFLVGSYNEPAFPHAIVDIVLTTLMIQQFLSGIYCEHYSCMYDSLVRYVAIQMS